MTRSARHWLPLALSVFSILLLASCGRRVEEFGRQVAQARSFVASGRHEDAMRELMRAGRCLRRVSDTSKVAYYEVLEHVYESAFAYSKATEIARQRLIIASSLEDTLSYGLALLDAAGLYMVQDSSDAAYGLLGLYESWAGEGYSPLRGRYLSEKVDFMCSTGAEPDSIASALTRYLEYSSNPDWLAYARGCIHLEEWALADSALTLFVTTCPVEEAIPSEYFYLANQVDKATGRVDSALQNMEKFATRQNADLKQALQSDVLFAAERDKEKRNKAFLYAILGVLLAFFSGSWIVWHSLWTKRQAKYELLQDEIVNIKKEYEKKAVASPFSDSVLTSTQARETIGRRIESLAALTGGSHTGNLGASIRELMKISPDRSEFVETLALLFAIYSPSFYSKLAERGLSRYEIGYCCLFVLGYRTKELQDIVGRKDVYNISSKIRSKIGLGPNDTNLSKMVVRIFSES